jgi:hypothetical protein
LGRVAGGLGEGLTRNAVPAGTRNGEAGGGRGRNWEGGVVTGSSSGDEDAFEASPKPRGRHQTPTTGECQTSAGEAPLFPTQNNDNNNNCRFRVFSLIGVVRNSNPTHSLPID